MHEEHINAGRTVQVRVLKFVVRLMELNEIVLVASGMDLHRDTYLAARFDKYMVLL